jgi:hypothetical protein
LPENPFRKTDTLETAVTAVRAADLKHDLRVDHVSHVSGKQSGPAVYRKNIELAVARLMRIVQEEAVSDPQPPEPSLSASA